MSSLKYINKKGEYVKIPRYTMISDAKIRGQVDEFMKKDTTLVKASEFEGKVGTYIDKKGAYEKNNLLLYKSYCSLCSDGTTLDWSPAFTKALENGSVFVPEGQYYITKDINLTVEGVGIYGVGSKSEIRAYKGSTFTNAMIYIQNSFVEIKNLRVCGRSNEERCNTAIIKSAYKIGTTDTKTNFIKLTNVSCNYSQSYGINLNNAYDVVVDKCNVTFCMYGYIISSTDTQISNSYASFCDKEGFRLFGGLNQLTNCKSYFNGKVGFYGTAIDYSFVNCDAQENGTHGFNIYNGNSIILSNCHSESNGVADNTSAAFYITSCTYVQLNGCKAMNCAAMKGKQAVGYKIESCKEVSLNSFVISRDANYNVCDSTFTDLYKITSSCTNVFGMINDIALKSSNELYNEKIAAYLTKNNVVQPLNSESWKIEGVSHTSSTVTSNPLTVEKAIDIDGTISKLHVGVVGDGTITVTVFTTKSFTNYGTVTKMHEEKFSVADGQNDIDCSIAVKKGQFIALKVTNAKLKYLNDNNGIAPTWTINYSDYYYLMKGTTTARSYDFSYDVVVKNKNHAYILYFSQSGNDLNDGLTPQTAKKNPTWYCLKGGYTILLKSGDVFELDKLSIASDTTISTYGGSDYAVLKGIRKSDNAFEVYDSNNSVYSLKFSENINPGFVMFNDGIKIWSRKLENTLTNDKEFWFDTTNYILYMKSLSDISGKTLYYSLGKTAIEMRDVNNVTINNIEIYGYSCNGIYVGLNSNNVYIRKNNIHHIGGGIQKGTSLKYGNGIESWMINQANIYITNNIVTDCFDAGITPQVNANASGLTKDSQNIFVVNNEIRRCVYPIEYFNAQVDTYSCKNIVFADNYLYDCMDITKGYRETSDKSHVALMCLWKSVGANDSVYINNNIGIKSELYALTFTGENNGNYHFDNNVFLVSTESPICHDEYYSGSDNIITMPNVPTDAEEFAKLSYYIAVGNEKIKMLSNDNYMSLNNILN